MVYVIQGQSFKVLISKKKNLIRGEEMSMPILMDDKPIFSYTAQKLVRAEQNDTIIHEASHNPLTKDDTYCCQKETRNI